MAGIRRRRERSGRRSAPWARAFIGFKSSLVVFHGTRNCVAIQRRAVIFWISWCRSAPEFAHYDEREVIMSRFPIIVYASASILCCIASKSQAQFPTNISPPARLNTNAGTDSGEDGSPHLATDGRSEEHTSAL